ncbi:MAG TPA: EAL domain-containing protein [Dokdonella sp.]|uniref:putative bifunctional diguanylate cyclase/phosphodiesterase n=1 Tax=Dokdonella sp. TaxID=2291710 RepID=UPI002D802103|nr:EAL domain-containing protein [Dokdonella sp.]HET9032261.1 EAL domain-containing protein [Dokdonella sp.]
MLPFEFGSLILLAALAVMLTAGMLELQTSATAYIIGESHWSKAQQSAADELHRYAASGNPDQLQNARKRLQVPLGDRQARLALEQDPPDLDASRQGFLAGLNAPEDVDRMIRMYRYFHNAPFFRDAVKKWRLGDEGILELQRLGDEMEALRARNGMSAALSDAYQRKILAVDARLKPIELAFSQALIDGTRVLRTTLIGTSVLLFLLIAWIVIIVLRSTLARIRASEGVFRAAFHQAAVGMLRMRSDGQILEANDAICQVLGYPSQQLQGRFLADSLHADDLAEVGGDSGEGIDWSLLERPGEHRFLREDGSIRWLRWTVSKIDAEDNGEQRVFAIFEDVSDSRRLSDEMKYQASHDGLTGLVNRREIERRLRAGIEDARRNDTEHAFLFLDLDQFKLVNDTCGHVAGDQLLRQISGVLMLHMRDNDWMGRLGGDEFAVLLDDTGVDEAMRIAERLRRALSASTFPWEGRKFNVTCSIGIARVTADQVDVGEVLRAADRACYQAKEDGRNGIRVYHESDQAMSRRRDDLAWVVEIRQAIIDGRIVLYAQRIEALNHGPGIRYEILVRLVDTEGEVNTPDRFLPAAERFGEAISIDRLVIAMTLRQLEDHPDHLHALDLCHVNVSAQSIANPDFRLHVVSLLDSSRVPASKLCFELTETAAIGNMTRAREFIDEMRSRGCRIALDDFGSGMASFAYLKNLPVDVLKIDGVFIRDLANNEVDPVLVRSMCEVARSLGKITVAEWVEDRALLEPLRNLGVDQAQGYGIHEPCALDELIDATPILKSAGNF